MSRDRNRNSILLRLREELLHFGLHQIRHEVKRLAFQYSVELYAYFIRHGDHVLSDHVLSDCVLSDCVLSDHDGHALSDYDHEFYAYALSALQHDHDVHCKYVNANVFL